MGCETPPAGCVVKGDIEDGARAFFTYPMMTGMPGSV